MKKREFKVGIIFLVFIIGVVLLFLSTNKKNQYIKLSNVNIENKELLLLSDTNKNKCIDDLIEYLNSEYFYECKKIVFYNNQEDKNNEEYFSIAEDFSRKSEELSKEAISYTGGLISNEALKNNIYVSEYTLPCEELTEKLFGIFIDTTITKEELNFREGINQNINSELINNIKILNSKALTFAKNFKIFCNDIKEKLDSNKLFSFSYIDFFSYLFDEVDTYTEDLERIIAMESYSPIYATGFAYNFANTLLKTAKFIRDWIDPSNSDVFDIASYYVNAFNEIIDKYLKSDISPDSQEELSNTMKNLLVDYQDFIKNLLESISF